MFFCQLLTVLVKGYYVFNFKVIIITFKLLPVFVTLMDKLLSISKLNIITYNPLHKFTEL